MNPITKQDLARNLLFWLLPWPLSRMLPKSLQIAYFGPSLPPLIPGQPPPWMPGYDPLNPWDPLFPKTPQPGTQGSNSGWYSYLSNAYWTPGPTVVWDAVNQWWNFVDDPEGYLTATAWTSNWRPEYLRITTTHTYSCEIQDVNADDFDWLLNYESLQIHQMTWGSYDLGKLIFDIGLPGEHITDIEFYGPPIQEPS